MAGKCVELLCTGSRHNGFKRHFDAEADDWGMSVQEDRFNHIGGRAIGGYPEIMQRE
jgi:hypothetical protein